MTAENASQPETDRGRSEMTAERPNRQFGLKRKTFHATYWTIGGRGATLVIRLGSNLILTRLLFPEAFGLMALVQVVLGGVQMFSDVGIRGSILQHDRGEDERFLNTAWTIQVIRGLVLCAGICLLTWPMSRLYEEDMLLLVLPVMGISAVIAGFESTARFSLDRQILPQKKIMIALASQLSALMVTVPWAWLYPSVWALVGGGLVSTAAKVVLSHFMIPQYKNRFSWDSPAARALFQFGIWVFLSTGLTFVMKQGDRLVLGKILTSSELGVYSVAFFMSQSMIQVLDSVSKSVLFPVYSKLARREPGEFRQKLFQLRALLLGLTLPVAWGIAIFGKPLVEFLYDERYADAGWMLQLLGVGLVGQIVTLTTERVLMARGSSFGYMVFQVCRSAFFIIGMVIGYMVGDVPGLLLGISMARWAQYIVLAAQIRRYGAWLPKLDLAAFGLSVIVLGIGFYFTAYG